MSFLFSSGLRFRFFSGVSFSWFLGMLYSAEMIIAGGVVDMVFSWLMAVCLSVSSILVSFSRLLIVSFTTQEFCFHVLMSGSLNTLLMALIAFWLAYFDM